MRGKLTLCILALSLISPGCALLSDGAHVVCNEMGESMDDCLERHRNRRWANEAWARIQCTDFSNKYSSDYAHGFKDGFAEYLYRGGDGEPPVVAPAKYRRFRYQTAQGYRAIEDWFAGYRHGAAEARSSNLRSLITGPVSSGVGPAGVHDHVIAGTMEPIPAPQVVPGAVDKLPGKDLKKAPPISDKEPVLIPQPPPKIIQAEPLQNPFPVTPSPTNLKPEVLQHPGTPVKEKFGDGPPALVPGSTDKKEPVAPPVPSSNLTPPVPPPSKDLDDTLKPVVVPPPLPTPVVPGASEKSVPAPPAPIAPGAVDKNKISQLSEAPVPPGPDAPVKVEAFRLPPVSPAAEGIDDPFKVPPPPPPVAPGAVLPGAEKNAPPATEIVPVVPGAVEPPAANGTSPGMLPAVAPGATDRPGLPVSPPQTPAAVVPGAVERS